MSAEVVIANLLRIAREDLDGAKILAAANNRNAVYLCEQAAEKIIRAVLTSEGKHAGIKHLLDEMVEAVPDANPIKPLLEAIEHLAAFATTYRYPTTVGRIKMAPPAPDLATYVADVEAALFEAVHRFGVDLSKPNEAARSAKPIRQ
jgi:HEPN domain-containing protein